MREFIFTGVCVFVCLIYLLVERLLLGRRLGKIPLRICVTGTRGKSSVVRLIAACLKESRMVTLAKTTGSKPCLIFPDGSEQELHRRGLPSILEGKKVLKKASLSNVHAVVLELMSIRPETLRVETVQMTKPHILIITNIREDHVEEMGKSKEDIARCLASALPQKATIFIPEEEYYQVFRIKAEKAGTKLILVPPGLSIGDEKSREKMAAGSFQRDFRLALAVAEFLGMDRIKAYRAAVHAVPDFGALKIWEARKDSALAGWYFVSAFAANDPQSTRDVLVKLEEAGLFEGKRRIALLNLRKDRGSRTMQWADALQREETFAFDRLFLVGEHASVLRNRLRTRIKTDIAVVRGKKPEDLIAQIAALEKVESVLFGMGNMGGIGRLLVDRWEMEGIRHDI